MAFCFVRAPQMLASHHQPSDGILSTVRGHEKMLKRERVIIEEFENQLLATGVKKSVKDDIGLHQSCEVTGADADTLAENLDWGPRRPHLRSFREQDAGSETLTALIC